MISGVWWPHAGNVCVQVLLCICTFFLGKDLSGDHRGLSQQWLGITGEETSIIWFPSYEYMKVFLLKLFTILGWDIWKLPYYKKGKQSRKWNTHYLCLKCIFSLLAFTSFIYYYNGIILIS